MENNPEKYKIEIESKGAYETKKEFNLEVELTDRQFLALVAAVLDHLDQKDQ